MLTILPSAGDFEQELYALGKSLAAGGIKIPPRLLESAGVRQVDFCKNALLPRDLRMQEVLADLRRVDISKVVDVTEKEVKHGGQVLHIYAKTIERVFYDKVLDSLRPKAKRKDKGYMAREREIIDRYGLYSREIFRYEYRLKKWQAVRREVNAALERPYQTEVTFKDLFTPGLCQKILLKSWRDLIGRPENQLALLGPLDDLALLAHIMDGARKEGSKAHSLNRALTSYGLTHAVRDHGAKEVRRTVFRSWNSDHSERLTEKLQTAAALASGLPYSNGIAFVDGAIERCEWITRSGLKNVV